MLWAEDTALLGKNYIAVMKAKGFPNAVFPVRQSVAAQDDVVFMYNFSYVYIYNNKAYRIFYSPEYRGEIFQGLKIGDPKSGLTKRFGDKYSLEKDGLLWTLREYLILAKVDEKNTLKSLWLITKVEK
jgi:hypothetical protein